MSDSLNGLRTYTNADVDKASKKRLGVQVMPSPMYREDLSPDEGDRPSYDEIMAGAHGSLKRAETLSNETQSGMLASVPSRLDAIAGPDPEEDQRSGYRRFTETLSGMGAGAGLAAIPVGMSFPPAGAALGSAAGVMTLPDYLRRWVNPEGNESHPGMLETGLQAAMMVPEIRGLSKGLKAERTGAAAARGSAYPQGPRRQPVPDPMREPVNNPNQVLAKARDITRENENHYITSPSDEGVDEALRGFTRQRGGGGKPSFEALSKLSKSGKWGRAARAEPAQMPQEADLMDDFLSTQGPKESFDWEGVGPQVMGENGSHVAKPVNPFAGARTLEPMDDDLKALLPEGGLSTIAPDSLRGMQRANPANDLDLPALLKSQDVDRRKALVEKYLAKFGAQGT